MQVRVDSPDICREAVSLLTKMPSAQLLTLAVLIGPEVAAKVTWFTTVDVGNIKTEPPYGGKNYVLRMFSLFKNKLFKGNGANA